MTRQNQLDLLEFSRIVKDGHDVSDTEFLDLMRKFIQLDVLRDITPEESEWLLKAVTSLQDYSLLLWEFHQIEMNRDFRYKGAPMLPGSTGPFIETVLTRRYDDPADFTQLENFGSHPKRVH